MKKFRHALPAAVLIVACSALAVQAQPGERPGRDGPAARGARFDLPTVDEMAEAISADPAQRAALAEARLVWVQAMREGPARGGRGPLVAEGDDAVEPPPRGPMMQFLVKVAPSLDTGETLALVELLEREIGGRGARGEWMERGPGVHRMQSPEGGRHQGMHEGKHRPNGGPGLGRGPGQHDPLVEELDLSAEQREKVRALAATTHGALRALAAQVGDGEEPNAAQIAQAERLRSEHQEQLKSILTPQQSDELLRLRAERRAKVAERRQARQEATKTQRLADLTALLDLDASQQKKVEAAIDEAHAQAEEEMAARMAEGGPMPGLFERPRERHGELRASTIDSIREVLRPQQRELFARVQGLTAQGAGGRRGPGPHPGEGLHPRHPGGPRGGRD